MRIQFYKYQGTGNDFVILDNRGQQYINLSVEQINQICNRRFGVGADGLMLLNNHPDYDFEMKYYNADGRESSMCGNGGRCLVKFAYDLGIVRTTYKFIAIDGAHEATVDIDGTVSLKMNDVKEIRYVDDHFILNTGSPHFVELTEDVMKLDVYEKGREVRYSPEFKEQGINVNFVEQLEEPDRIIVRTYERGVEDETYSCGTGVTAAALVCHHNDNGFNRVEIQTLGGNLSVEYDKIGDSYQNIWLQGPALRVFSGQMDF
ncbi:diaminopimelate epimerase [Chitinophagaceae bacterium LB-8]|uniref:Diaminopimelate epimerase n=1 Tax=Paraflavisolibacter caeni TaxID=2982496 RepID=A0A9X3BHX6_9BACT|nr:diaminopimelate epimerase [Paraflavisolibacter caeni]MCU7550357.1 diaminopimelate epimerase [Paraflavisolibacter caeni]